MKMNIFLEKKVKRNKVHIMSVKRKNRVRFKLKKISSRSRLSVFRSNNHLYAQIINDLEGVTIASASTLEKELAKKQSTRKEMAEIIGKKIAERSIAKGVNEVAFDKGKYKYHGLIKILADSARAEGLNF